MNSVEQKVFESMCKYADLFIKESANMTDQAQVINTQHNGGDS